MTILEKSELLNISGGVYSIVGPNFKAYRKLDLGSNLQ